MSTDQSRRAVPHLGTERVGAVHEVDEEHPDRQVREQRVWICPLPPPLILLRLLDRVGSRVRALVLQVLLSICAI